MVDRAWYQAAAVLLALAVTPGCGGRDSFPELRVGPDTAPGDFAGPDEAWIELSEEDLALPEDWAQLVVDNPFATTDEVPEEPIEIDTSFPIADEPPAVCRVKSAVIKFGPRLDPELLFPRDYTSPKPARDKRNTGKSVGLMPIRNGVIRWRVGNSFEAHFTLNGVDGCKSDQLKQSFEIAVNVQRKALVSAKTKGKDGYFGSASDFVQDKSDDGSTYVGTTTTGKRAFSDGFDYEGRKDLIHWIDGPGLHILQGRGFKRAVFVLMWLRHIVYDGDSTAAKPKGMRCDTFHTFAVDPATGKGLKPRDAHNIIQTMRPGGGPGVSEDAKKQLTWTVKYFKHKQNKKRWFHKSKKNPRFITRPCKRFGT